MSYKRDALPKGILMTKNNLSDLNKKSAPSESRSLKALAGPYECYPKDAPRVGASFAYTHSYF